MINRVLIRIKVVQMLYSYLLTRSEFRILPEPAASESRDHKFAYKLYLDTLLLILELSGRDVKNPSDIHPAVINPLYDSKMIKSLHANAELCNLMLRPDNGIDNFNSCIAPLQNAITGSAAYRSYIRTKDRDIPEDVAFWNLIIRTVIAKSAEFEECARRFPDFTMSGMEQGLGMVQETLGSYGDTRRLFKEARVSLDKSLNKAYELYHALLMLPVEITQLQAERLDEARNKYLPTDEDLNPSTRFVDNKLVEAIAASADLEEYLKNNPFSWENDPILIRQLLDRVLQSEAYKEYMSAPGRPSLADDAELWRNLFRTVILPDDDLAEALENKSVYWNDDLAIMGDFVLKTIRRIGSSDPDEEVKLLPKFKDKEDEVFGSGLFVTAVNHHQEYRDLIFRFINTSTWDADRLAFMDIVVMIAAITELLHYPNIPIPVTLNEYIEIAKAYSTPRSGEFVNGILFSVINHLKEEGKLIK